MSLCARVPIENISLLLFAVVSHRSNADTFEPKTGYIVKSIKDNKNILLMLTLEFDEVTERFIAYANCRIK